MAVMAVAGMNVVAQEVPQVANVMARQTTSLNGEWNFIVDVQEEGYYDYRMNPTRWGFFRNAKPQRPEDLIEYDFDKARTSGCSSMKERCGSRSRFRSRNPRTTESCSTLAR